MIRLDLPIGPSLNQLYPGKTRRYKSSAYRNWISTAGWHIRAARCGEVSGPYTLTLLLPVKMRGDVDNRLKAVSDLLALNGVTPDDKHCFEATAKRSTEAFPGRCIVIVEEIKWANEAGTSDARGRDNTKKESQPMQANNPAEVSDATSK